MDAFHWLLWLTILYLVILVTALAAGLIAIGRALIVAKNNLAKIDSGLIKVEAQTRPLGTSMHAINAALAATSGGLSVLLEHLRNGDSDLGHVADKLEARR